jgi:hypothetical protein
MSTDKKTFQVFLSYSNKDRSWAEKIGSALKKNGLDVWDAQDELSFGDNFASRISEALEESDAMVVLISPESMRSEWVRREIAYAVGEKSYNGRLVPVLLEPEKNFPAESIPWILKHLNMIQIAQPEQGDEGILQIVQTLKENSLVFE